LRIDSEFIPTGASIASFPQRDRSSTADIGENGEPKGSAVRFRRRHPSHPLYRRPPDHSDEQSGDFNTCYKLQEASVAVGLRLEPIGTNPLLVLEGVYLYTHNVPPYDGGVFHQAPLFLPLFSILDPFKYPFAVNILYTALDLLSAEALIIIANSGEAYAARLYKSPRTERYSGVSIAARYTVPLLRAQEALLTS
jgi:GPI transamidase subunit PIG-U